MTWLQALHGGKVLSPASYRELIKPATLSDGTTTRYAAGLEVRKDSRGLSFIGHSGELPGYAARANWYPDAQMAIVVLMNNSGDASPSAMAAEVLPVSRPTPRPFTGDAAPLAGTYKGTARDGNMVVTVKQATGNIAVSVDGGPSRLVSWVEGLTFQDRAARLIFRRGRIGYDAGSGYYILERLETRAAMLAQIETFIERRWPLFLLGVVAMAAVAGVAVFRWSRKKLAAPL